MLFKPFVLRDVDAVDYYLGKVVILLFGFTSPNERFTFQHLQIMGARDLSLYHNGNIVRQVQLPSQKTLDTSFGETQHFVDYRIYLSDRPYDYIEHRVRNSKRKINEWFYGKTGTQVSIIVLS